MGASTEARCGRLLLLTVLKTDIFQRNPKPMRAPCATCEGTGLEVSMVEKTKLSRLCSACGGGKTQPGVGFR